MSQMHNTGDLEWDQHDRLQKALRVSGHTAGSLAEALGVHRNTIGNYLSGRTPIDKRTLMAWAMACGVPIAWLETGTVPGRGGGRGPGEGLPRHDSNVEPFGQMFSLVSAA